MERARGLCGSVCSYLGKRDPKYDQSENELLQEVFLEHEELVSDSDCEHDKNENILAQVDSSPTYPEQVEPHGYPWDQHNFYLESGAYDENTPDADQFFEGPPLLFNDEDWEHMEFESRLCNTTVA